MILTKLAAEYENLVAQGKLDRPGWTPAKVSYALELDEDGQLIAVLSLRTVSTIEGKGGKPKTITQPRILSVPEPAKRTVDVAPNFLCDNSTYILGIDKKDKPERTAKCFQAARELHHRLLDPVDNEIAHAICRFFDTWRPEEASENTVLKPYLDDILKGGNLIFSVDDSFAHEDSKIRAAWQHNYSSDSDDVIMQCLDTGKWEPVAILHPNLKGIRGTKSMGASLISFNKPAYESYGRNNAQGLNAPVSKNTTFAYSAALNYLLADFDRVQVVGDTTVVCWAESGKTCYQDVMCQSLSDGEVQSIVKKLSHGEQADLNGVRLDPEEPFYVLGLSPNAARAAVRFFLQGTFGDFARNVNAHYERLEITRPITSQGKRSVWGLLQETVNQNASDKTPKPQLAGDLLRAILLNTNYPETLLQGVEIRIRADRKINWRRAAIIKAFLIKNRKIPEEELIMNGDGNMTTVPGKLGQLFSLLEQTQLFAIRGKNYDQPVGRTIADSYFTSASNTPAVAFPTLVDLNKKHLAKIKKNPELRNSANILERRISMLMREICEACESYPVRLNMTERGKFQLGYYFEDQRKFGAGKRQESVNDAAEN